MNTIHFQDTLIHLDAVARVEYIENDHAIVADNQCAVFFQGNGSDAWVIRGEQARPLFDRLREAMEARDV